MIVQGSTILVTGGGGSLGSVIADDLRAKGAKVIRVDAKATADMLALDLTDPAAVDDFFDQIFKASPPAALINAVGSIHSEPLVNLLNRGDRGHDVEAWQRTVDRNLNTVFLATRACASRWAAARAKGVVVNFSSVMAAGNMGQGAYSAAKAGIEALTTGWAKELGALGIRVAGIAPGFIDTPSTREALSEAVLNKWLASVPLRRLGRPEEVAHAVQFILENDYYHGRILQLDGGLRI